MLAYVAISVALVGAWLFVWKQKCVACLVPYRPSSTSIVAAFGSSLTASICGGFSVVFLKVVALAISELLSNGTGPTLFVFCAGGLLAIVAPLQVRPAKLLASLCISDLADLCVCVTVVSLEHDVGLGRRLFHYPLILISPDGDMLAPARPQLSSCAPCGRSRTHLHNVRLSAPPPLCCLP